MSKKPGADAAVTRQKIIEASVNEFYEFGFRNSSLRRICEKADVTTGAIYFFFSGKDDLFRTVTELASLPMLKCIEDHYSTETGNFCSPKQDAEAEDIGAVKLVADMYYGNKKVWDIIMANMDHQAVKDFISRLNDISAEHYMEILSPENCKHVGIRPVQEFHIRQFVRMQTDTILSLLTDNLNKKQLMEYIPVTVRMLRGAFFAMIEKRKDI